MSNSLDPDQDRHSVGPDLVPNCLQRLPVTAVKERFKSMFTLDKDQGRCFFLLSSPSNINLMHVQQPAIFI